MNISDAFTLRRLNCDSGENSKHLKWVKELVVSTKGPCENQAANLRSYRFLKAWNNAKSARRTNEANRPNKRQKNDVEREWHSKQKTFPGTQERRKKKASFMLVSQSHVLKDFIHDQRNIMDLHLWIKLVRRADINFLSFRSSSSAVRQETRREIKNVVEMCPKWWNLSNDK